MTVPTVRQAEGGRGLLGSYLRLASALGLEIGGRSLPPGGHLGGRLAAMRQRRGWSRRTVARLANISATTLAALEQGAPAHLATAVQVTEVLGIQLRLHATGLAPSFWSAAGTSSAHHGWSTPPDILNRLYGVVGGRFDLDPCSPSRQGPVKARLRYTVEDDGLRLPWRGSVYVNPPYGRGLVQWVAKACAEIELKRATTVIALLPARTDTKWWHEHVAGHADTFLLKGRLSFGNGSAPAPFASALAIWGTMQNTKDAFARAFADAWHVPAVLSQPRMPRGT